MGIYRSDVDCARKEGTASIKFRTQMTVMGTIDKNTPEHALEVAVGREHDAFKTGQFGRP